MIKLLLSTAAFLIANAVGLLLAAMVLPGFTINPLSFVVAVLIFSVAQGLLGPLIRRVSAKNLPQLMGGIALVTVFVGLFVTDILMAGMDIGGIANWLGATLLVWLGSLIANILLPRFVFKDLAKPGKAT